MNSICIYLHICTEYERDIKILIDLKLISFVIEPTKLIKFVISLPVNCLIMLKVTTHVLTAISLSHKCKALNNYENLI